MPIPLVFWSGILGALCGAGFDCGDSIPQSLAATGCHNAGCEAGAVRWRPGLRGGQASVAAGFATEKQIIIYSIKIYRWVV